MASGPRAVPARYEVVASNGTGSTTTWDSSGPKGRPYRPLSASAAASGSKFGNGAWGVGLDMTTRTAGPRWPP